MTPEPHIPPPCDPEIFQIGQPVLAIGGNPYEIERWVKAVALGADARVDWHYSGGRAQVLHLGDVQSRLRVFETMSRLRPTLEGTILGVFREGDAGLFRSGVTPVPPGATAAFFDGGSGSTYLIESEKGSDRS